MLLTATGRTVDQRVCARRCNAHHEFRAILFDFDGTIVDTDRPDFMAWAAEFERHGLVLDPAWWLQHLGAQGDGMICVERIERELGHEIDRAAAMARHDSALDDLVRSEPPRPGVRELLEASARSGMTNAVVSSASRRWVSQHLQRLGLTTLFSLLVTREDSERHKPDPAPYLLAEQRLGLGAGAAFAVEDSLVGLRSAERAGVPCLYVPPTMASDAAHAEAEFEVDTLANVDLADLLASMGSMFDCQGPGNRRRTGHHR